MDDSYTYPSSGGVLRNKQGITDPERLDKLEVTLALLAAEDMVLTGDPDLSMLRWIHRGMFGDLFEWAGETRTVFVTAAGTSASLYCAPAEVGPGLSELFGALRARNFLRGLDRVDFLEGLDWFWGSLTRLHPFRDGNTRSQTVFVDYLCDQAGHLIDPEAVDSERLNRVRLSAAAGNPHKIAWYLEDKMTKQRTGT